jgi:hypothetical protein
MYSHKVSQAGLEQGITMNVPLQHLKMQHSITLQLVINVVTLHKLFMRQETIFQFLYTIQ